MNAVKELLMRIRSTYDGAGTTAAAKAVGTDLAAANTKASETAKKTGKDVQEAGKRGADSLNIMSAASAAMQGNFQGAASAAVPLLEKSKALNMSMTQLSLAGALLSAVVTGLRAMSEWADAAAQRISKIQMDNLTNKVNASAEAYDKLAQSMAEAAALADADLAYNNSMVDAYTRRALAVNELAKRQEMLATNDESKRAEIEAKYAKNAVSITGESEAKKGDNQLERSLRRESEIQQSINAAEERRLELIEEAESALRRSRQDSGQARKDLSFSRMLPLIGTGKESFTANSASAEKALGLTGSSIENARSIEAEIKKLQNEKEEVLRAREVAGLNSGSRQIEGSADEVAKQTAHNDRRRAEEKENYAAFESLRSATSRVDPKIQKDVQDEVNYLYSKGGLTTESMNRLTTTLDAIVKAFDSGDEALLRTLADHQTRMRNIR
jgi:hypothetical protein